MADPTQAPWEEARGTRRGFPRAACGWSFVSEGATEPAPRPGEVSLGVKAGFARVSSTGQSRSRGIPKACVELAAAGPA